MSTRELKSHIFGRDVSFEYSETWIGYSLLGLRFVMGLVFLIPGIQQAWDPTFSVRGLLVYGIPEGNPLTDFWATLGTEWAWLFTPLNSVGLTLIGLALILGAFVRFSAFWGSVMMFFYYLTSLHGGLFAGLPLANGYVIDDHIVYILILFGLGAFGSGRILGLDAKLEELDIVERYPRLKLFLG
jgi:thiosulfate dehydrogenase [quinone] large subunit